MYTIYAIKYLVTNGIIYIGNTSCDPKERFGRHIADAYGSNKGTRLGKLIRVSNLSDFEILTLESSIPTLSEAHERERYYINKYKTHISGCNMTAGGYGTLDLCTDEDRIILKEYIKNNLSLSDISKKYDMERNKIVRSLNRSGILEVSFYHNKNYCPYIIDPRFYIPNAPPYTFRDI